MMCYFPQTPKQAGPIKDGLFFAVLIFTQASYYLYL